MTEFVFETDAKTWEFCTKVFSVKGTISSDFRVAVGVTQSWDDPYEYVVTEGFPVHFNETSTTNVPILQITIKTAFNNSLATVDDHIQSVYAILQKDD